MADRGRQLEEHRARQEVQHWHSHWPEDWWASHSTGLQQQVTRKRVSDWRTLTSTSQTHESVPSNACTQTVSECQCHVPADVYVHAHTGVSVMLGIVPLMEMHHNIVDTDCTYSHVPELSRDTLTRWARTRANHTFV